MHRGSVLCLPVCRLPGIGFFHHKILCWVIVKDDVFGENRAAFAIFESVANDNSNYQSQLKRYVKGKSEKWENPPTVDVKVCTNNKAIASYISKYFSKKTDNKTKCNELDNENNSFSIRLWYCSRSLSRLQSINDYKENIQIDWFELLKGVDKVKQVICDYAVCLFFDIGQMPSYIKGLIYKEFRKYANSVSYNSA